MFFSEPTRAPLLISRKKASFWGTAIFQYAQLKHGKWERKARLFQLRVQFLKETTVMKRQVTYLACAAAIGIFSISASAQFAISIPNIPKVKVKKKADTQNQSDNSSNNSSNNSDSQNSSTNNSEDSSANSQDCSKYSAAFLSYLDEITKNQKEAAAYDGPENKAYYTSATQENFVRLAISKDRREAWWSKSPTLLAYRNDKACNKIDPALDELAKIVARTVPLYVPEKGAYAVRSPHEEALMKDKVTDIADLKILSIGLASANWTIETNSIGIPTDRYKYGMIYVKPLKTDDPYCRMIFMSVFQQYSGGGTYGATNGNFIRSEVAGCPAGK